MWQAPIIITCGIEDLKNLTILTRVSEVVEFVHPTTAELTDFFIQVCKKEEINLSSDKTMEKVVEGCGGDIRRLLNTLNFLAFDDTSVSESGLSSVDVTSIFYNQTSMHGVFRSFVKRIRVEPLEQLGDVMELHPVSLATLVQENYPRLYDKSYSGVMTENYDFSALSEMADRAELISVADNVYSSVYAHGQWESQECCTILSTWGVLKMCPSSDHEVPCEKSEFASWHQIQKHRRKLFTTFPSIVERGLDFVEVATLVGTLVDQHKKDNSSAEASFVVGRLKEMKLSYKDCQDLWKCARVSAAAGKKMPNPRGKRSLLKLL